MTWAPWSSHGVTMGIKHLMNAHRPRAPRKQSLRGWNLGGGCRALHDGGKITSNQLRVTSNQ